MATGDTPAPAYKGLAYGENQRVNQPVPRPTQAPAPSPQDFTAQTPEEQFLFSPSSRPSEPVTHGAPVGPGAMFVPLPNDNETAFRQRVANDLLSSPSATPEVQAFAKRMLQGG